MCPSCPIQRSVTPHLTTKLTIVLGVHLSTAPHSANEETEAPSGEESSKQEWGNRIQGLLPAQRKPQKIDMQKFRILKQGTEEGVGREIALRPW